jgi:phage host-nuclease inhibitor protein Gam
MQHNPDCSYCAGSGQFLGHAPACSDDLCALNGDEHSCAGELQACDCKAPFTVDDAGKAAWALDKVLAARERVARIKAACEKMIGEAETDARDAEAFFLPLLEEWARANPPAKGKTIRLTTGALAFRSVPGGPRVADEAATLAWARAQLPDAVRVRETVLATAIREYVTSTGDILPGIEIAPARESFDVKGA